MAAEVEDPEERAQIMLAIYEHFEQRAAVHRRPLNPWPKPQ